MLSCFDSLTKPLLFRKPIQYHGEKTLFHPITTHTTGWKKNLSYTFFKGKENSKQMHKINCDVLAHLINGQEG